MEPHPYRQAFAARDLDGLMSLLADDVILHSGLITGPGFEGHDAVAVMLTIILDVMKDDQYTHDLGDERSHLLVADSRVLDEPIKMTTLLEFNPEGKIHEIWLMTRPLRGTTRLLEAIARSIDGQVPDGSALHELAKPVAELAVVIDRAAARLIDDLNRSTTEAR